MFSLFRLRNPFSIPAVLYRFSDSMFHLSVLSPSDSDIPKIHLLFLLVSGFLRPSHSFLFLFPTAAFFHRLASSNARLTIPTTAAAPPSTRYQTVSACVHRSASTPPRNPMQITASTIFFQRPSSFSSSASTKKIFRRFRFLFSPKCFLHLYRRIFFPRTLFSLLLRRFFLLFPCLI